MTAKIVVFLTKITLVNLLPYQCFTLDTCELNQTFICMNDPTTFTLDISEEKPIIADTGFRWEKVLTFEVPLIFAFACPDIRGVSRYFASNCNLS